MIFQDACWGIDIGKNSIKAVRIRREKGRVEIKAVDHVAYEDLSEGVPTAEAINRALRTFISRNSIKSTDSIAVALPGHMALIRFVKVPQLSTADLEESIVGEAQQQIPFPLDSVMWGYQKIDRPYEPGEDMEIGLFAIKKEIIDEYLAEFDDSGLEVDILTIAPLALFNFAKFEMNLPDNAIIVDVGADHTDLVIMEGNKFYVRELAMGGNDITRQLMETFSISFEEAEDLKKKSSQSSQSKKIFTIMEPMLREFVTEIQRSLGFYKSQNPGVQFPSMVLLGNASKLNGLAKFFGTNLGMKVHYLMDIERIELDRDININILQEHLPTFGIAMGLALQGVGCTENAVNLIPEERKGQKELTRKLPLLLASAMLLFLLIGLLWWDASKHLGQIQDLRQEAADTITDLRKQDDKARSITGEPSPRQAKKIKSALERLEKIKDEPESERSSRDKKFLKDYEPWKPKHFTIKGIDKECQLLARIGEGFNKPIESANRVMAVLGTRFPDKNGVSPCHASKNIDVSNQLMGKSEDQLKRQGMRITDMEKAQDRANRDKLWVIEYEINLERDENGAEELVHRLIGAIPYQADEADSLKHVDEGLVSELKSQFNLPDEFNIHKVLPKPAGLLVLPKNQGSGQGTSFFQFELEWKEPVRAGRPDDLPEKRGSKKKKKGED